MSPVVHIHVFEGLREDITGELGAMLENQLGLETRVSEPLPLPEGSYNKRRRQYRSDVLLEEMAAAFPDGGGVHLGVTDLDLFIPGLNFIFGQADRKSGVAVISLARLKLDHAGKSDKDLFLLRALKEAVHELGHVFGLDHCRDRECIMFFSNVIEDTDLKGPGFCGKCGAALEF